MMDNVIGIINTNYSTQDLGTLTSERTGASLPYGGRYRLIDFHLSNMINAGITAVGVITPHKYRSLIDHIGSGKEWALDRKNGGLFILPGAVFGITTNEFRFLLRDLIRNKVFLLRSPKPYVIITASNVVYNMDYDKLYEAHVKSGADITMVYSHLSEDDKHLSSLKMEGDRVMGISKGARAGSAAFLDCFIIGREFLLNIMDWYSAIDHLDLFDVLQGEYEKMDVRGYEFTGYAGSVFSMQEYFDRNMELLRYDVSQELFGGENAITTKVRMAAPCRYYKNAVVKNSLIPSGCIIEGTVENSVLFGDVKVEKGAIVKNSIIFKSCVIEAGARVEYAILDRGNTIKAGTTINGTALDIFVMPKVEQ